MTRKRESNSMLGMLIYIWRHGKAESVSESGKDQDRSLAPEGRNEVIDVADYCFGVKRMRKPQKIFASPFQRARESAEMIQGFLGCEKGLEIVPELKSGGSRDPLVSALKARSGGLECFALVGHIPDLENLCDLLLGGTRSPEVQLKTGGIVLVEVDSLSPPFNGKLLFSTWGQA